MYHLFRDRPPNAGGVALPGMVRIRDQVQAVVDRVIKYRQLNPVGYQQSILVRLLHSLNVPMSLPDQVYVDRVNDVAFDVAMTLKITSPISRGSLFRPSAFYGSAVGEVLVAVEDAFDLDWAKENWDKLQPIRLLYQPQTDLRFAVPDGRVRSQEGGIAVITINVAMLAYQYRCWRKVMEAWSVESSNRTVMQFLNAYPIPNMLYSHVDWAIVNRAISLYFGIPMPKVRNPHSFGIPDWEPAVDGQLQTFLENSFKKTWTFDQFLEQFPLVFHDSMHDLVRLPDVPFTPQIQWAFVAARTPLLAFLTHRNHASGNANNQRSLNELRRYFLQMDLNRTLSHSMPRGDYENLMGMIEGAIQPYL